MLKYSLVITSLLGPGTRIAVTLATNWLNILINCIVTPFAYLLCLVPERDIRMTPLQPFGVSVLNHQLLKTDRCLPEELVSLHEL